mgnify:CR=1 FL=1
MEIVFIDENNLAGAFVDKRERIQGVAGYTWVKNIFDGAASRIDGDKFVAERYFSAMPSGEVRACYFLLRHGAINHRRVSGPNAFFGKSGGGDWDNSF